MESYADCFSNCGSNKETQKQEMICYKQHAFIINDYRKPTGNLVIINYHWGDLSTLSFVRLILQLTSNHFIAKCLTLQMKFWECLIFIILITEYSPGIYFKCILCLLMYFLCYCYNFGTVVVWVLRQVLQHTILCKCTLQYVCEHVFE